MDKDEQKGYMKAYHIIHRKEGAGYSKKYRQNHKSEVTQNKRIYLMSNRLEINKYHRRYYHSHSQEVIMRNKLHQLELKREALIHYGDGKCTCIRCGFDDIRALSIDHIDGNGNQHRQKVKVHGSQIYQWLKSNNYPEGYQTLCMNCQFIKRIENQECHNGYYKKPK